MRLHKHECLTRLRGWDKPDFEIGLTSIEAELRILRSHIFHLCLAQRRVVDFIGALHSHRISVSSAEGTVANIDNLGAAARVLAHKVVVHALPELSKVIWAVHLSHDGDQNGLLVQSIDFF